MNIRKRIFSVVLRTIMYNIVLKVLKIGEKLTYYTLKNYNKKYSSRLLRNTGFFCTKKKQKMYENEFFFLFIFAII